MSTGKISKRIAYFMEKREIDIDQLAEKTELDKEFLETMLKEKVGVRFEVEVHPPGALDADTEIHTSPKPKRFRDERGD